MLVDDTGRCTECSWGAQLVQDVESWLADPGAPGPKTWSAAPVVDPAEAKAQAWTLIVNACKWALDVPGLLESDAVRLAEVGFSAAWGAGAEPDPVFRERRLTEAERARRDWYDTHGEIARSEGGVLAWDDLEHQVRHTLYREQIVTVDEVRDLAREHKLQTINGIGPTRAETIMRALDRLESNNGGQC